MSEMRTIYRSFYVQTRGVFKKELQNFLRNQRAIQRSGHVTQQDLKLRKIKDVISINERLLDVEDPAAPGHRCRQEIA